MQSNAVASTLCACSRVLSAAVVTASLLMPHRAYCDPTIDVTDARVPPVPHEGADVPLLMRVVNRGTEPDSLLRAKCPFANFSERHTVDHGEGAPSMRAVSAIPIPAGGTVTFSTDGFHVMLVQTRQPLNEGDAFTCAATFKRAGTISFPVTVAKPPAPD